MRVLGIHPIEAREPVHLVEIEAQLGDMPIDWSAITQPIEGRDRSYWQAPYDERKVPNQGSELQLALVLLLSLPRQITSALHRPW